MFEAHPFLTLLALLFLFVAMCFCANIDQDVCVLFCFVIVFIWSVWAFNIPDTPEEVAAKQAQALQKAEEERIKSTPRPMSQADGCTVYVFERQGREHFFTRCEATTSTETNWTEGCGKGCSRDVKDTIMTPNIKEAK